MNIILLSGGSGKRLWPLSNDVRSKQFLKLFRTETGEYESMVQRMFRGIRAVDAAASVTIATSLPQVSALHNQLGTDIDVSVEPERRDTFPAIALAAAYLADIKGVAPEEPVVVCPVDPYVTDGYFTALAELSHLAADGRANLCLLGMEPTYPSEKYGYILPADGARVADVRAFREKPDKLTAQEYIASGALWNGGVFAFRLGYLLDIARRLLSYESYADLYARYAALPKISFDYAVAEREESIAVMRFSGEWRDLGTWNTLTEVMDAPTIGNVTTDDACENLHVINELNIPVLCMGLRNAVVAVSPEGILVTDKEQSSYIKPYVERFHQQIMYAEKSWGSFRVLDASESGLTIKVTLHPGHAMNYHSHERRDEVWTVIRGTGRTVIDGARRYVHPGDVIRLPAGCRHAVMADAELEIIEVQYGKDISVHDKKKYPLPD